MHLSFKTSSPRSPVQRGLAALAVASTASLLLVLPGAAGANQPAARPAASGKVKSRIDRLSVRGVNGGVLVRGSVLPGTKHVKASVTLLLRRGGTGAFKKAETVQLAANDRNFALLHPLANGTWAVKIRFQDPGHVVATTSRSYQVSGMPPAALHSIIPGQIKVNNGTVTYNASIQSPQKPSTVQLLGLDVGPVIGAKGNLHTPAGGFKSLATTQVPSGTGSVSFSVTAKLKQGQRWSLLLERSSSTRAGIDYEGLKTVRVS